VSNPASDALAQAPAIPWQSSAATAGKTGFWLEDGGQGVLNSVSSESRISSEWSLRARLNRSLQIVLRNRGLQPQAGCGNDSGAGQPLIPFELSFLNRNLAGAERSRKPESIRGDSVKP
jgi:hypothetical protein